MTITSSKRISRRELLKRCMVVGAGLAVGTGFVAGSTVALWRRNVTSKEMATLIRMARDVYPHNHIPDEYYARAMKGYDSADSKSSVSEGLRFEQASAGKRLYRLSLCCWEDDRIEMLKNIEDSSFFQTVRGNRLLGYITRKRFGHSLATRVSRTRRVI